MSELRELLIIEESWDIELESPYASFTCPLEWLLRGRQTVIFALGKGEVIAYAHRSEEQTSRVTVELIPASPKPGRGNDRGD